MRAAAMGLVAALAFAGAGTVMACGDDDGDSGDTSDGGVDGGDGTATWEIVQEDLPGALLSVWGAAHDDIWAVGGDPDGEGPMVLHYDGTTWNDDFDTGGPGDLWWVFGFSGGDVFMGGAGGRILTYDGTELTSMTTPAPPGNGLAVFGIWGCSPEDMWAVGGAIGGSGGGFAWRREGDAWVEAEGFPPEIGEGDAVWKVYGRSCDDVWMIGTNGLALHWDGESFGELERISGESLFTLHANSERFAAVGGFGGGIILENDGSGWESVGEAGIDPTVGICLTEGGGYVVGWYGSVQKRVDGAWVSEDTGLFVDQTFHAVWVDPIGDVWAVGGQVQAFPLVDGVMIHYGQPLL